MLKFKFYFLYHGLLANGRDGKIEKGMEEKVQIQLEGKFYEKNIVLMFFVWLFWEAPAKILETWVFFMKFALGIFSVPLLLRTFFSPWHRYWFVYPKGFDPELIFWAFFGNLMSRILGMILRTIFIIFGLVFEIFVLTIGAIFLAGWILTPFVSIYLFYLGMTLR